MGLARACVGGGELTVRGVPDALDAAAGAQEKSCGSQGDKSHQQGVLDKILSLFIVPEVVQCVHVCSPILQNCGFGMTEARSDMKRIITRADGKS